MPTVLAGAAGLLAGGVVVPARPARAHALVPLALVATAALPFYAFVQGHPFRVRYMVVLVLGGVGGMRVRRGGARANWAAAGRRACSPCWSPGPAPLDAKAPMVLEAQWDRPASRARQAVTACLARRLRPAAREDPGQHGVARALHAGTLVRGLPPGRLRPRGDRRHLAGRGGFTRGATSSGSSSRSSPRAATSLTRTAPAVPGVRRRVRADVRGRRRGALPEDRPGATSTCREAGSTARESRTLGLHDHRPSLVDGLAADEDVPLAIRAPDPSAVGCMAVFSACGVPSPTSSGSVASIHHASTPLLNSASSSCRQNSARASALKAS